VDNLPVVSGDVQQMGHTYLRLTVIIKGQGLDTPDAGLLNGY